MDNLVLRSALVTQNITKNIVSTDRGQLLEWASAALAERQTFNLDRRTIAIGGSEEIWLHDLLANPTPEWFAMIVSMHDSLEMMISASRPQNILTFNAGIGAGMHVWAKENSAKITFMNNSQLDVYEQHMMSLCPQYTLPEYDAIGVDDLEAGIEEKFDFIFAMAYDIISDPELQQLCVDALAPNGILYIALANNGSKLYRDGYHTHPYADIHEFLKSCDGYTYHNTSHYGFTVFVKN